MTYRVVFVALAATIAVGAGPTSPQGEESRCADAVAITPELEQYVAVYDRLINQAGRDILTVRDLRSLREGAPFELDPNGASESLIVADGLRSLGVMARARFGNHPLLRAKLTEILERRLLQIEGGARQQTDTRREHAAPAEVVSRLAQDTRHASKLSVSSDGKLLATIGMFEPLRIYSLPDGARLQQYGSESGYWSVFVPGPPVVMMATSDAVEFWSVDGRGRLGGFRPSGGNPGIGPVGQFVEDGRVALVAAGRNLHAIDVPSGTLRNTVRLPKEISMLTVSHDQSLAVVGSFEGELRSYGEALWERRPWWKRLVSRTAPLAALGDTDASSALFSRSSTLVATSHAGTSPLVVLRDGHTLEPRFELKQRWGEYVHDFSEDGRWLATFGNDQTARVWDIASQQVLLEVPHLPMPTKVWFLDDRHVAVGSSTLSIWDVPSRREIVETGSGNFGRAVYPMRRSVLLEAAHTGGVRLWKLANLLEEAGVTLRDAPR